VFVCVCVCVCLCVCVCVCMGVCESLECVRRTAVCVCDVVCADVDVLRACEHWPCDAPRLTHPLVRRSLRFAVAGASVRRWLLVNVQASSVFDCSRLNRDVWRSDLVRTVVSDHFVFAQYNFDSRVSAHA